MELAYLAVHFKRLRTKAVVFLFRDAAYDERTAADFVGKGDHKCEQPTPPWCNR